MGITLIVTRSHDWKDAGPESRIERFEWTSIIDSDDELRLRTMPHEIRNPKTGEFIKMPATDAEAELQTGRSWVPFLYLRAGELVMRYDRSMNEPDNPVRLKIASIANRLGAVITHDAGNEILDW